jgi:hypothetical protein
MKFTSSARRPIALFLSLIYWAGTGGVPPAMGETDAEPCILLKVSVASIPQDVAKTEMGAVQAILENELRVRWVPAGPPGTGVTVSAKEFPVADGKALEQIAAKLAEAARFMDRMETKEAAERLADAEALARSFRFGDTTRPYLAEVFLRRGLLSLWEGNTGKAEEMLARSRVLRPEFEPDPAIFSPLFLESWSRSGKRVLPQAELLVTSVPSGARIVIDGKEAGRTPGRVPVTAWGPVSIAVIAEGYQPGERTGQWLPGDSEALDFSLVPDRNAVLAELLASSPEGKEAGPLLSRMMAESGARRVALLFLEEERGGLVLRILSLAQGEEVPKTLGTVAWGGGDQGYAPVAASATELLAGAGWPVRRKSDTAGSSWYGKWWIWAALGAAVIGFAAAGSGGGGGGGTSSGSSGTIGVNF